MKKMFVIVMSLAFVFGSVFFVKKTQITQANTNATSGYAKVLTNDCYFFEKPEKNAGLFLLEQSYFVKVIDNFDDVFFKVRYLEFEGYVERNKICFAEEYPTSPFLVGITFDIYDLGNVCMRSSPETFDNDKNILCTIPVSTKNLIYYGKCVGEEAIEGLGNIWYYSCFEDAYGNLFKGYVYAPLTRNLSAITNSSENLTLVSISNFVPMDSLLYLNLSTKNILILITALPTLLFVFLFSVPNKILKRKKDD